MYIDFHTHKIKDYNFECIQILSLRSYQDPPSSYFTAGIHPWDLGHEFDTESSLKNLDKKLRSPFCLGLGECGLDRSIETNLEVQKQVLKDQLFFANKLKLPLVVIHAVRSIDDTLQEILLSNYQGNLIFHDYNGSIEQTKNLLTKDQIYFSYGKKLFQKQTKAFKSLKFIPIDRLFFETDDTDLSIDECYKEYVNLFQNIDLPTVLAKIKSNFKRLADEKSSTTV